MLDGNNLYCLGDIVHNDMEVQRLHKKGLRIIDRADLNDLRDCKVLIRAHVRTARNLSASSCQQHRVGRCFVPRGAQATESRQERL